MGSGTARWLVMDIGDIFAAMLRGCLAIVVAVWLVALPEHAPGQTPATSSQDARAGRFDAGKMWTFEYPPVEYFSETYAFDANPAWFERARMAALRIPGCSASFVSARGLLATNHHCVRGVIPRVTREGEALLDSGFYATSLRDERRIPDYYADQLIAIEDVSDAMDAAGNDATARAAATRAIEERLLASHGTAGDSVWVQVVRLYNGGRHSAYVFRRFTDIRLVMAVELSMGFFGGDPDNFTYPRYALDFAFLRAYDADGAPHEPSHYFGWGANGVQEGDVVFVIGNPGPTSRLTSVAQLEFLRDVQVPVQQHWLRRRHEALARFRDAEPEAAERFEVRNRMFSLSNSLKAATGRLEALHDATVMARRRDAERALSDSIARRPALTERYGGLFDELAAIQSRKRELAAAYGALYQIANARYGSQVIRRAVAATAFLGDSSAGNRSALLDIADLPPPLERGYLVARLEDVRRYYGADHPVTRAALPDGTPEASAASILAHSSLATAAKTSRAVDGGQLTAQDPAVRLAQALLPADQDMREVIAPLERSEDELAADLGRVKFAVYGRLVPPDATSSPRITDGIVSGYFYNGTLAPAYTTFFGIYDRHYGHRGSIDWELPARWVTPPAGLALGTPLNFVSTADTYGGNSGSPAVTKNLELVGLNFDRNIQGLSRDYIYLPEQGRNIMVDARGIHGALVHVYRAERLVEELAADSAGAR